MKRWLVNIVCFCVMGLAAGVSAWAWLMPLSLEPPPAPARRPRTAATAETIPQRPAHPLCLTNGTLIDGAGADPTPDAVVVIDQGRIIAAGPRAKVATPANAQIIDVRGGFILPGFINCHVHNVLNDHHLRTWARQGVTTVRDVGAPEFQTTLVFSRRDALRANRLYPRIVAAGPLVTVPGGYPIAGNGFPSLTVTSVDDARQKTRRLLDQGAQVIKLSLEPGGGANWPTMTQEQVKAIIEEAHARGIPVTAHVTQSAPLAMAVEAGLDDACHSSNDPVPDALLERMVRSGIAVVPTLTAQGKGTEAMKNLRRFLAAGGKVAMGNDGGYLPGLEVGMPIAELEAMHEAGMTPMQVIVASTKNAAEVCRLRASVGTVEPGKQADLLIVAGSPLEDLKALRDVQWVIRDGAIIRRPE